MARSAIVASSCELCNACLVRAAGEPEPSAKLFLTSSKSMGILFSMPACSDAQVWHTR